MTLTEPFRVLVAEKIAATGVDMLRERFDVDLGTDWSRDELLERIGGYHGMLIRSATKADAELIERADNLRVIGRAGVGVDNVDVAAASKRGIIVANAPEANTVAAAEHTVALMLALARNIPQAHASLTSGKWERSKFGGTEVDGKTLGVLGFGRIGQLVADPRARVRHARRRLRPVRVQRALPRARRRARGDARRPCSAAADFLTLHLPKTPETQGFINAETLAQCKDGVRIVNVARGPLVVDDDLQAAIDSGKVAGAALDVFAQEPITDHPLFGYPNVVVTPHLGASTAEAQDRAGVQTAEQVVAALTGGVVSTAVNIPAVSAEDMEVLGPFIPLAQRLGQIAAELADSGRPRRGRAHGPDRRARHPAADARRAQRPARRAHRGGRQPGQRAGAGRGARDPGLRAPRGHRARLRGARARDASARERVVGTTLGRLHRPHLLEAWGQRFNLQIDDPHLALFRYSDVPGMVGRVGSRLGERGHQHLRRRRRAPGRRRTTDLAVMAVTTDQAVPADVLGEIAASEGFVSGRAIPLG